MTATAKFTESRESLSREELLQRRIGDLQLQVGGTRLERLAERLYDELEKAGISLRPPIYLSDEWGCPDRVPIIGVPFYLADRELSRLHDELAEGVEGETDDDVMRYLRHETGHTINYAYKLYETPEWSALFGPFARPYVEDYRPNPFSRSFVRHLPGWYAQKHPDEDFAETFAVWLTPKSAWRESYADWACFPKLLYVDESMRRLGRSAPVVTPTNYDTKEEYLATTVAAFYGQRPALPVQIPNAFDSALRDVFRTQDPKDAQSESAAAFVRRQRRAIVAAVHYWTGLNDEVVRGLTAHLEQRCDALALTVGPNPQAALTEIVAMITTLCMNYLQSGSFVPK